MSDLYDCVIIGSGVAGTMSAMVLAQMGLKVVVLEAKSHPRFAIGESLIVTTTQGFEYLADTYNIPELQKIVRYPMLRDLGLVGWPKPGFWLGYHEEGVPMPPGKELVFSSPISPKGADVHFLRSDVDHYLVSQLKNYGVDYWDFTQVLECDVRSGEVILQLDRQNNREQVKAKFILDCSGYNSPIAKQFDLRDSPPNLRTNSRAIFSHFRDVVLIDHLLKKPSPQGIKRDFNTVHHCFEGGWFWIIRFDNKVTSIGLMLDRELYPGSDLSAEEEFNSFVQRFPTVQEQFRFLKPIRNYTKTGRIQYSSHTIAGDRYLLSPHAASFIDPLFGTGLDITAAFIIKAAPIIKRMVEKNDFHAAYLQSVEHCFFEEMTMIDKVVHGAYHSFRNYEIFKQFWRCWIYMSAIQYATFEEFQAKKATPSLAHYGASLPIWQAQFERMYNRVLEEKEGESYDDTAVELKAMMDPYPEPFDKQLSNWELKSPQGTYPVNVPEEWFPWLKTEDPILREAISSASSVE